jgi:exodeoxyribonuclease VII small subunit
MMPNRKKKNDRPDPDQMSYEDAVAELQSINERIESGEIGLEEMLSEYRRGVALAKRCHSILDAAEQELKKIKAGGEGAGQAQENGTTR